jgi:hypothetical protein
VPTVDEVSAARRFEPKSLDISWRSTWAVMRRVIIALDRITERTLCVVDDEPIA